MRSPRSSIRFIALCALLISGVAHAEPESDPSPPESSAPQAVPDAADAGEGAEDQGDETQDPPADPATPEDDVQPPAEPIGETPPPAEPPLPDPISAEDRPDDAWDDPPPEHEDFEDELPFPEDEVAHSENRFGFGVGIDLMNPRGGAVLFPMDFGAFRFEPLVMLHFHTEEGSAEQREESRSELEFLTSFGLMGRWEVIPADVSIYGGARLGVSWQRSTLLIRSLSDQGIPFEEEVNSIGVHFAPVFGAEYMIIPELALGVEVELDMVFRPEEGVEPIQPSRPAYSSFTLATGANLVMRWLF